MLRLRRLRDDQWDWIKDILPGRMGCVGATAADNRLFVDAVLYRYRTGIPWRDLPNDLGGWKNIHRGAETVGDAVFEGRDRDG